MTDIWYISAELEDVDGKKMITFKMDEAQEYARPSLGAILLWCREPCERLLKDLEKRKAKARDIEYVKKEIEFLKEIEEKWRTQHKSC